MFKFLEFIILVFFLFVFLLGFLLLRFVKNIFFGGRNRTRTGNFSRPEEHRPSGSRTTRETYARPANRKKIFAKDEGEYVDYEEVK